MITKYDEFDLFDYFSYIFCYGLKHRYSFSFIENRISNSRYIKEIENQNTCSFLNETKIADVIKDIYELSELPTDYLGFDTESMWISEAYFRIFFKFKKSFSFIFLYLSLSKMSDLFPLYHEMDWTQLYDCYVIQVNSRSLLKTVLSKKHLSINKLSQLTGISPNTLISYLDDRRLKEAKFDYIYKIANTLELDLNMFVERLNINLVAGQTDLNPNEEGSYKLIKCLISYYKDEIAKRKYVYDKNLGYMVDEKGHNLMLFTTSNYRVENSENIINKEALSIIEKCNKKIAIEDRPKYVVVIMEYNMISKDPKLYKSWSGYGYEAIYILNSDSLLSIKQDYKRTQIDIGVVEKIKARL